MKTEDVALLQPRPQPSGKQRRTDHSKGTDRAGGGKRAAGTGSKELPGQGVSSGKASLRRENLSIMVGGSLPGEQGPRGLLGLGGVPPSVTLEARLSEASSDRLRDPRSHWRTHIIELRTRGTKGRETSAGS